jgi:hypothetical protein
MTEAPQRKPMTLGELRQLALDIADGKVFTSNHIKDDNMVPMVFTGLMFLTNELREKLIEEKATLIYEYYDEQCPRSINGYPIFFTFRYLTEDEANSVHEMVQVIIKQKKEFLNAT